MKNEKRRHRANDAVLDDLEHGLTNKINSKENQLVMNRITQNKSKFQYSCSFCACELPIGGTRFNGVGACAACNDLAHLWVDSLRDHEANYFNNLGVRK
jgi:hypothetical protein